MKLKKILPVTLFLISALRLAAQDGNWNVTTSGNWSLATNWSSNPSVPGGDGAIVNITNNIVTTRTVTIDTTSRTVGQLTIGDSNGTDGYVLAASGGAGLVFQNLGNASQLTFTSTGLANSITAPISLASDLVISNNSASQQSLSGNITASTAGLKTIEIGGTGSGLVSFSGTLSDGSGQIGLKINNINGGGVSISANNTSSGSIDLMAGRLVLAVTSTSMSANSTLNISGGTRIESNTTSSRNIRGNATLTGTVSLGNATNTGTINFNDTAKSLTLLGNSTIEAISAVSMSHDVAGAYSLTKTGSGILLMSSAKTFSGGFILNNGTVHLALSNALGTGTVTLNSGTIASSSTASRSLTNAFQLGGNILLGDATNTGAVTFSGSGTLVADSSLDTVSAVTLSGVLDGGFGFTKRGGDRLTLSGANTFSGGITLESGTLLMATNAALGTGTLTITGGVIDVSGNRVTTNNNAQAWNGGFAFAGASTLDLGTGSVSLGGNITLDVQASTLTVAGSIGDGGNARGIVKNGAGTLALSGANTFTGALGINAGNLTISGGNAIADNGAVILADAAGVGFNVTASETIGSLQGGGASGGLVTISSSRLLTVAETGSGTFSGVIAGSGGVVKNGFGTLVLAGANTYTGVTRINEGVLSISSIANGGNASGIGASAVTASNLVLAGGTLRYTGANASTDRRFTAADGTASAIDVTNAGTVLTISGSAAASTGSVEKLGNGTLAIAATMNFSGGFIIQTGTVTALAGSSLGVGGNTASFGASGMGTINLERAATTFTNSLNASTGNGTILINPAASGAGVTHTIGAATLGGDRVLTVQGGGNVTSGTAQLTTGAVTLNGNATLNVVNPAAADTSTTLRLGALSDDGTGHTLTKTGNGTLTLATAASSLSVGTGIVINSGTLRSDIAGALASAATANATTVTVNSGGELRGSLAGAFKSGGAGTPDQFILLNDGTLRLASTVNTDFGGNLEFRSGSVVLDRTVSSTTRTFTMGSLLLSGGTLAPTIANFTSAPTLVFGSTSVGANSTVDATNAGLTLGSLNLLGSELTLAGSRAYTLGATTVAGNSAIRSTASAVGTLSSGITGTGNLTLANDGATANGITISTASANHTGRISNTGTGTGNVLISAVIGTNVTDVVQNSATSALTLNATNTYTGATIVSAGSLILGSSGSINSSSRAEVATGAQLVSNNTVLPVSTDLVLNSGAILSGSGSFAPVAMTLVANLAGGEAGFSSISSGTTSLVKSGNMEFTLSNPTAGNYAVFSGTNITGSFGSITVGGVLLSDLGAGNFGGSAGGFDYTFTNTSNMLGVVPEPSTWALLAVAGIAGMVMWRRGKKTAAASRKTA